MANQNKPNLDRPGLGGSLGNLAEAVGFIAKTGAGSLGGIMKGGAKVTGGTAKGAGGLVGGVITKVSQGMARVPNLTFLVGLYAAAKGVQHLWRKHKEKKAADAAVVQVETPPQPATMQQGQGDVYAGAGQGPMMQHPGGPSMPASSQLTAEQQEFLLEMQRAAPQHSAAAVPPQGQLREDWVEQINNRRQQPSMQETRSLSTR